MAASTARSGSSPVLDRPSRRQDQTPATGWPRWRRQHAVKRIAQRRDRPVRLDVVERARPRRFARARPGRRFQVVEEQLPAAGQRFQVAGSGPFLTRSSRGVSRSRSTGDRPPADSSFNLRGDLDRPRFVGVRIGELHALGIIEDHGQMRRDRLAMLARDQDRLDQHGREGRQRQRRAGRPGALASPATGRGAPSDRAATRRQEDDQTATMPTTRHVVPLRQCRELEPRTRLLDSWRPGDRSIPRNDLHRVCSSC